MADTKNTTIRGNRAPARLVRYIMNSHKTNPEPGDTDAPKRYVSAWGCKPFEDSSIASMQETLDLFEFGKTTSRVIGYHYIQSFSPGETNPEMAHAVGRELISRLFGDNPCFQIIQGTHLDKGHLHNHFFIMSLSNVDGHRLRNDYNGMVAFYKKAKEISDEICRENHLSVIGETVAYRNADANKNAHYSKWAEEKEHSRSDMPPPIRVKIRRDIDKIIEDHSPDNSESLLLALSDMGYEIKMGKHVAIKSPGGERFIRLRSLGYGYTEEDLASRFRDPESFEKVAAFTKNDIWTLRRDIVVARSSYVPRYVRRPRLIRQHYILLMKLGISYRDLPRSQPVSKTAIYDFRKMTQQFQYMQDNKIMSYQDLVSHTNDLMADRKELIVLQHRMYGDRQSFSDEQRKEVNRKVRESWAALRICQRIGESHAELMERISESLMER